MIRIGVISERKTNEPKGFLKKYKITAFLSEKNPFELLMAELPYSKKRLEKMPYYRIENVLMRAERVLRAAGAEHIVMCEELREYGVSENIQKEKRKLFLSFAPECIRTFAPACGMKLPVNKICIRDSKLDRITEYLIQELSFDAKGFLLCTENIQGAERLAEYLFEERGFPLSIKDTSHREKSEVVVDVDAMQVRTGRDLIVDGIEFDFDSGGYSIDSLEVACLLNCPKSFLRISSYILGKKKLTLEQI